MKIELDKNEELEITHKGSVRKLVVGVDEVDDICFRAIEEEHEKTIKR